MTVGLMHVPHDEPEPDTRALVDRLCDLDARAWGYVETMWSEWYPWSTSLDAWPPERMFAADQRDNLWRWLRAAEVQEPRPVELVDF